MKKMILSLLALLMTAATGAWAQSLGQVLGYDGCYDSGTCPHGY